MDFTLPFTHRFARTIFVICGLATISIFAVDSQAQTVDTVDRSQILANPPGFHPGRIDTGEGNEGEGTTVTPSGKDSESSDMGTQEILGKAQAYQPFTALLAVPFFYTSNAKLSRHNEQGDFVTVPEVSVTYAPRITSNLYGEISVENDYFDYARFSELNFDSVDVRAGLACILPEAHNLILRGYYDFNQLISRNGFQDFSNHSIIISSELPFRLAHGQQVSFGTSTNISVAANHDFARRDSYDFYVGYDVNLTRAFSIDAVGRVVVRDYIVGSRGDVSEILSFSANYRFTRCLTGSFISQLAENESNHGQFDYGVANVGGALSLRLKF